MTTKRIDFGEHKPRPKPPHGRHRKEVTERGPLLPIYDLAGLKKKYPGYITIYRKYKKQELTDTIDALGASMVKGNEEDSDLFDLATYVFFSKYKEHPRVPKYKKAGFKSYKEAQDEFAEARKDSKGHPHFYDHVQDVSTARMIDIYGKKK